ncbi:hypothetical protein PsorP6_016173 [Peronosclerospora sorghi]|uniref:Uncharacterized protein n=1 Tax=Peronosclerospora sorghi TaxID=230839 RepID=A0ACC0VLD1_9STRA|nr:hypothetical protein PsorP6_016173 [Peronosclerospora sorghi]
MFTRQLNKNDGDEQNYEQWRHFCCFERQNSNQRLLRYDERNDSFFCIIALVRKAPTAKHVGLYR